MLFAHARHFRGPVEDRDEVGVEAWGAACGAPLAERRAGREAEALGAGRVRDVLGVVASE